MSLEKDVIEYAKEIFTEEYSGLYYIEIDKAELIRTFSNEDDEKYIVALESINTPKFAREREASKEEGVYDSDRITTDIVVKVSPEGKLSCGGDYR